jgi:LmbE family N-acetylglucosaminyl deacetylase
MAAPHLFVSPHLDDVALSCGGLVAHTVRAGASVQVVTVCAGDPVEAELGALARELHRAWGLHEAPVAARREEDREALSCLGAEPVWLPELDAIYRHPSCDAAALYGPPNPQDDLTQRVVAHLRRWPAAARCYVPLAVGGHMDHELVHRAGVALLSQGVAVAFYEDLPYALSPGALAQRLRSPALAPLSLRPVCVDVTAAFPDKLRAVQRYRSQIPGLFQTADRMLTALTAYAVSLAPPGRCCERLWLPGAS